MQKKWGGGWQTGTPQKNRVGLPTHQKDDPMILSVCVNLKEINDRGRTFKWPKPNDCPRCCSVRIWGHGYVLANFDGFPGSLWLRRYRCPDCHCIIRMKPEGYFQRFQASTEMIVHCLIKRLSTGRWDTGLSSSRQRHWLAALKRNTMAIFGFDGDWFAAFFRLQAMGQTPVSRAI